MVAFSNFIDLRLLLMLSPITTAIAWSMLIYEISNLQDPWQ